MYHSTTVLLDAGETLKEQGSLAKSPFSTSTLPGTVTVTAPRHPGGETGSRRSENAHIAQEIQKFIGHYVTFTSLSGTVEKKKQQKLR